MSEKRNNRDIYFTISERKKEESRVSNNFLDIVIKETKNKRNLNNIDIKRKMIQDQVHKRRHNELHPGHASQVISIEHNLVTLMNKMFLIYQPLNYPTSLELVCSLVKGSTIENK